MVRLSVLLRLLAATVFCSLIVFLSTGIARSQQTDPLVGKWKMLSTTPDGDQVPWKLTITYADGKYSATAGTDQGEDAVNELKVDGAKIHFRVPYHGNEYYLDLKLDGDSLVGAWSGQGSTGDTKGQRSTASMT